MEAPPVSVVAVEIVDSELEVCDLAVDVDQSFVIEGGIVAHNTPICRSRAGNVYKMGEGPIPPAHWNCLPGDAYITTRARVTAQSKRWFEGELVVLRTASGRVLRSTPNHPVLTDTGWQPAHAVDLGCRLICDPRRETPPSVLDGQNQHVPSRIEDVAEAFLRSGGVFAMPVPQAAEDFHGEGRFGEVAIVGSDSCLFGEFDPALAYRLFKAVFERRASAVAALGVGASHLGFFVECLSSSPSGGVGAFDEKATLTWSRAIHACLLLLASVPERYPSLFQDPLYGTWTDAELIRDAAHTSTGEIFFDDVVGVERESFHGLVYNLEVGDGIILADGLVTHNCRSTIAPIVEGMDNESHPQYDEWLSRQPASVQDDILGKTRGKLFRDGGLPMKGFVSRKGEELTLEELRDKEAGAWKRAFGSTKAKAPAPASAR